ncbi:MAG: UbiX family flavin prenyltransferase [Candidatus Scalindua sp.]|nr:UbiX family flavin prenyltransferase [Candidatus Scalindua sp.]
MKNIVVAITGASGVVYGQRLLQVLCDKVYHTHLIVSDSAIKVIEHELGLSLNQDKFNVSKFTGRESSAITQYNVSDIAAPISSGTFETEAMIIVPCSMNTLCSIANGISTNLVQRVASVNLKEGRKLVVVPRETPLTSIHLEGMLKLSQARACIMPAMPGFYSHPETIEDQIDFIVGKILGYVGIEHLPFIKKGYKGLDSSVQIC